MKKHFKFYPESQVASLIGHTSWHRLQVHTLLQNPTQKRPSINAYLGARYSRSADSIAQIAEEVLNSGADAAKRLESIFQNYGHKSVGDMADLFLCLENVPMITGMRLFYINPVLAGQERSTRYQDFSKPSYIDLPPSVKNKTIRAAYKEVISYQLTEYARLLAKTKEALITHFNIDPTNKREMGALMARAFDTARYFIPMGLETSLGFVMSARNWSELISQLKGSVHTIDQQLGELIFDLLTTSKLTEKTAYIPEADGLIRHTEANVSQRASTDAIIKILKPYLKKSNRKHRQVEPLQTTNTTVSFNENAARSLAKHYLLLIDPLADVSKISIRATDLEKIGTILATHHNHHRQIGNMGQSGALEVEGFADLGTLKDLNRHRSLERFVPVWQDMSSIDAELNRPNEECYFLCEYLHLKEFKDLKAEYVESMNIMYQKIRKWLRISKKELSPELRNEYGKYLLTHGHATKYNFYGSIDDLQYIVNLRTRAGGHIAYRNLTYTWAQKLAKLSPLWKSFYRNIPAVDPGSREQFLDRS